MLNPLTTIAISKLLEMIGRSVYILVYSIATALHSDINQTSGSGGRLSIGENRCMHAAVCLLHAGQPRRAGDVAKSGQFIDQFSWDRYVPMVVKGLMLSYSVEQTTIENTYLLTYNVECR